MKTTLDDILCFEVGSNEPPWEGLISELQQDLPLLQRLAADGVIELDVTGKNARVSGVDRVGLIMLTSGRRLIIRSKIDNLALLDWLAYLGEFPPLDVWLPDAGVATGDDFHACIARLFLYELDKVTRQHLRKDYTPVNVEEPTIRGKINAGRLVRRLNRLPRVPQRIRARTFNTIHNIVLALALDRLPSRLLNVSSSDRRLYAGLNDHWVHIQRGIADPVSAVAEAQWSCPPGYRAALQLARLILLGVALDPESKMGGQALTMSLALVWERALRRMCHDTSDATGWVCMSESERTRQWDDSEGRNDPTRWLTADVLVQRDQCRWVLDAKYKKAFGNESRSDRFQMCAYAVGFNADRVSLVYPTSLFRAQRRILLEATFGLKHLVIESINLPMHVGPNDCKDALVEIGAARPARTRPHSVA